MRQNENVFTNIDLPLFFAMILLMIFGIATVYSVSFNPNHPLLFAPSEKYGKQFIWLGVSLFIGFLILLINSEIYRKYAEYLFVFTILMLVLVLFMPPVHGARAWLGIGGLGIQPAEFAKISTALLMAKWVAQTNIKLQNMRTVSETVGIILLPSLLVALQPDAGTLLVFTSFLFVLYREGISFDPIVFRLLRLVTRFKFTSTWVGTHFIPLLFFMVILCVFSLYTSVSSLKLGENLVVSGTAGMVFAVTGLALLVLGAIFLWGFKRFRVKNLILLYQKI